MKEKTDEGETMKRSIIFAAAISLLAVSMSLPGSLRCEVHRYDEDFSSKLFCDTLNTTAWWDTVSGELKLYPFELMSLGGYGAVSPVNDIVVDGDFAYLCSDFNGLYIFDISDPSSISLAGHYDTPGNAFSVEVAGDYAFVADYASGLTVVDISDPSSPTLANGYSFYGQSTGIAVAGNYAFMACGNVGLQALDITDPTSPTMSVLYTGINIHCITISGDYAYAGTPSGMNVFDISDPVNPVSIAFYDAPGASGIGDIEVDGDLLYASGSTGLYILDISDPYSPSLVGSCDPPGLSQGIDHIGQYVYFASYTDGIHVIDVSDPSNPVVIDNIATTNDAFDVVVAGEHAFVADAHAGIEAIDIADLHLPPARAGSTSDVGPGYSVAKAGHYVYVQSSTDFSVMDVSDPTDPLLVSSLGITLSSSKEIAVSGNYVFAAYGSTILVFDVSDPTDVVPVDTFITPAYDLCVDGDYLFSACGNSGLLVFDITDPQNLSQIGSYDPSADLARGVIVTGDFAYLSCGNNLYTIDVSDPSAPGGLNSVYCSTGDLGKGELAGDHLFIAAPPGLIVCDIVNKTSPVLAGQYVSYGIVEDVSIDGDFACVAVQNPAKFTILDITDPEFPDSIGVFISPDPWYARDVLIAGDYIYGVTGVGFDGNLEIIKIFERNFDHTGTAARSTEIENTSASIVMARLSASFSDSVKWYLSADGAMSWQLFTGSGWQFLDDPGSSLFWRSIHGPQFGGINATATDLSIEWLYDIPEIDVIEDIPDDQGRNVRIAWSRSGFDISSSSVQITEYAVYRRVDMLMSGSQPVDTDAADDKGLSGTDEKRDMLMYPPGDWDFITSVPAYGDMSYSVIVPTLGDSSISEGVYHSVFFVRARTETPGVYYDAWPDSGWSVDNLAPAVPTGISLAYNTGAGNDLAWDECPDVDFDYFVIYRSEDPDFIPGPGDVVQMVSGTGWLDTVVEGWRYSYKITAVDFNGNESEPGLIATTTGSEDAIMPEAFELGQNVPNPFNPSTTVYYDVPEGGGDVSIRIFDVSGRLVRTLVKGHQTAGSKSVTWNGANDRGQPVSSGIYFYRMTAPGYTRTKKMVLLR